MNSSARTSEKSRMAELEARLVEAEETLRAIRSGEVDALLVTGPEGDQIYTLQGAETPYRTLVEAMNEGALLLTPDGTVLFANSSFAQLINTPLQKLIGSSWREFFPAAEQSRLCALLERPEKSGAREEFLLRTRTGEVRPVQISLRSMEREGVRGFSVILSDLSERKASELELRRLNESLESRVQLRTAELVRANEALQTEIRRRQEAQQSLQVAKEELAQTNLDLENVVQERTAKLREMVSELHHLSYAIVHDMRAPLRAMEGFANILLEHQASGLSVAESQGLCRRIINAAARLDDLIRDTLIYNQAVLEEQPLGPVNLATLVPSVIETYPNLAPDLADIRVEGELPVVLGSKALLTQCFSNLLGNAVKFVARGTRPNVKIRAEANQVAGPEAKVNGGMVRIWVEDNGIGIPEGAQSRLFGIFQRLQSEYEGTGIGLAIVRKVVQRMGGEVGVESQPGQGSRFWVELQKAGE